MSAVEDLVARALAGEHVPELPQFVGVNIARLRQRLLSELPALAREASGAEDFERRWAETVTRIFDEAQESLRIPLEPEAGCAS